MVETPLKIVEQPGDSSVGSALQTKVYVNDLSEGQTIQMNSGLKGQKLKSIHAFGSKKVVPFWLLL